MPFFNAPGSQGFILHEGDSIVAGLGSSDANTKSWPYLLDKQYFSGYQAFNKGIVGLNTSVANSYATTGIDYMNPTVGVSNRIMTLCLGVNDVATGGDNQSTQQTYNRLLTYLKTRQASLMKWGNITIGTITPFTDATNTARALAYNAMLRVGLRAGGHLVAAGSLNSGGTAVIRPVADIASLTQFDADGDYNNSTYYNIDKIHPKDAGYALMPAIWAPAILSNALGLSWGTPPLDAVGSATAAYGLRKLRAAYAGPCIRIRRNSDNAEADIGFDVCGNIDLIALNTHVGVTGIGYVVTWYDQAGSNNATQAIQANQPILVSNVGFNNVNNLPCIFFANGGTPQFLKAAGVVISQPATVFTISGCTTASGATAQVIVGSTSTATALLFMQSGNMLMNAGGSFTGGAISNSTLYSLSGVVNGASSSIIINGSSTSGNPSTHGINGLEIGSWQNGALGFGNTGTGYLSEIILYPSALSSGNQTTIRTNQGAYFGVTTT